PHERHALAALRRAAQRAIDHRHRASPLAARLYITVSQGVAQANIHAHLGSGGVHDVAPLRIPRNVTRRDPAMPLKEGCALPMTCAACIAVRNQWFRLLGKVRSAATDNFGSRTVLILAARRVSTPPSLPCCNPLAQAPIASNRCPDDRGS